MPAPRARRWDDRRGLSERPDPLLRERRISVASFLATCCSVFVVYLVGWQGEPVLSGPGPLLRAAAFTATLMAVLLAHEAAHFLVARGHGFRSSLPWFLPAPVLAGTFGAIIRLERPPPDRAALIEMGAAGPVAGFGVTLFVLLLRLALGPGGEGDGSLGLPLVWRLAAGLVGAGVEPVSTGDPLAFAAWLGCLLTAINLLPFGQLDGGHVLSGLAPRWTPAANAVVTALLLAGGALWVGWPAWAAVIWALGLWRPVAVERPAAPPTRRARAVAVCVAVIFALCVVPDPA